MISSTSAASTPRAHLKVTTRIAIGLGVVLMLGFLAMWSAYLGLARVDRAVRQMAEAEGPASAAAYEMEINVNGIGLAVLVYLESGDPRARLRVDDDHQDFKHFLADYQRLAVTDAQRELGLLVSASFDDFIARGQALMDDIDERNRRLDLINEAIQAFDKRLEDTASPGLWSTPGAPLGLLRLEAEIAEVGLWLGNEISRPAPRHRERLFAKAGEFRAAYAGLDALPLSSDERARAQPLSRDFEAIMEQIVEVLIFVDTLSERRLEFRERRASLDDLLDEEVQILALERLYAPSEKANATVKSALQRMQMLIPVLAGAALLITVWLARTVIRPLERLRAGTAAVAQGNLQARIEPIGHDEFADLTRQFNSMVEELEATTVSKALLEASEEALRGTLDSLRGEVAERVRAEQEKSRLKLALGRSRALSAMGSLVAGVAHEVRNPLFGISSTVDALEAKLRLQQASGPYLQHFATLRVEVQRMSRLMEELLTFGKPPNPRFAPVSLREVAAEAAELCSGLAEARQVQIDNQVDDRLPPLWLDRERMVRSLRNLIENALQHAPVSSPVEIRGQLRTDAPEPWVECQVLDRGPGFPLSEDLDQVFGPFFTQRQGGTGLGLSIVQRIVEQHGGVVSAEHRPDGGAVVTIRLPMHPSSPLNEALQA